MDQKDRLTQLQRANTDLRGPDKVISVDVPERYRRTFQDGFGQEVLGQMLMDLGLFAHLDGSQESVARHNFAVELLANIGLVKHGADGRITAENMKSIVFSLMRIAART